MQKNVYLCDEDMSVLDELREGDRVVRKESTDAIKKIKEYERNTVAISMPFTKSNDDVMFDVAKELTGQEYILLGMLTRYIQYNTCLLTHSNGKLLDREDICETVGKSERTIDRILEGLVKKKVFGRHKTGKETSFTVNPFIFMKGHRINKTVYKLFSKSKWAKNIDAPKEE